MSEIENLKIYGGATYTVGNENIIANEWEAGVTYVKGKSYVIREHKLYVCNITHTSVEPFDPDNWTEITVGDAIAGNTTAIGSLSTLTTTDKSSIVGAVNEVVSDKADKSGMFKIQSFSKLYSVAADSSTNFDNSFITVPTGYSIGAVLGFTTNQDGVTAISVRPTETSQWAFQLRKVSGSAVSNIHFTVTILFIKSDLVS